MFCVSVGFQDIPNPAAVCLHATNRIADTTLSLTLQAADAPKTYSIWIGDTVRVAVCCVAAEKIADSDWSVLIGRQETPEVMTGDKKVFESYSCVYKDDDDDEAEDPASLLAVCAMS